MLESQTLRHPEHSEAARAKPKWVTPSIVEMLANETYGKQGFYRETTFFQSAPLRPFIKALNYSKKNLN